MLHYTSSHAQKMWWTIMSSPTTCSLCEFLLISFAQVSIIYPFVQNVHLQVSTGFKMRDSLRLLSRLNKSSKNTAAHYG